jgi:hypothetical protein
VLTDPSRTTLDVLIVARRWTAEECVRHFADTATAMGEPATLSATQLKRWRRGRLSGLPRPTACRVAEQLFGFPAEELFAPPPPGFVPSLDLMPPRRALGVAGSIEAAGSGRPGASPDVGRRRQNPGGQHVTVDPFLLDLDVERDPVMSAAHDASEHAATAGQAIEDTTLEQLHAEVVRLAHCYATTPPMVMFAQLKRARDLAYLMLERTRRPAQIADLYLVAGQLSGLMAGASYDLGQPDAASEQARAALTYGQVIDHNTLRAWARATLSMIAFWSGRPSAGVVHAQAGLEHATTGDAAARLHAVAARSWALTGSRDEALAALRATDDARASTAAADDLAGSIGGEFVFGPARQELSAGATFLALDEPVRAANHAAAALGFYESGPSEQRAIGGVHGARVDLAIARALGGDVDGVLDAVGPTLRLAAEHRTSRLNARLHRLRGHLASPRLRGSLRAGQLADDVEGFLATTCGPDPRALP